MLLVAVFSSSEMLALSGVAVLLRVLPAVMTTTVAALTTIPSATLMLELVSRKNNPFGVKALRRTPAKPHWTFGRKNKVSSA